MFPDFPSLPAMSEEIYKDSKKQKDTDSNFMPNKPCSEGLD